MSTGHRAHDSAPTADSAAGVAVEAIAQSGAEVVTDSAILDFYSHDIYARGADLLAVVRPKNITELAAAVAATTAQNIAVVARGGGMSYTGGYTQSQAGAVLFDLAEMNRILDINETDATITVEAGCTWAQIHRALAGKGLRTPFWGSLSGLRATVGGAMSQNAIFWGSGRYGTAAQNCNALEVVLADGTIMKTAAGFARPYGPDITGLFLADSGALAIKAHATLPLISEAQAHGYASFTFDNPSAILQAMAAMERAAVASECFAFDPQLNAIRMQRDSLASDAKALGNMVSKMSKQGSVWSAAKAGAQVISAGRGFIESESYVLHVLAEGNCQAAADVDIATARNLAEQHGGREVENTIPKILRANPFAPLNSILGPQGERWAPIHGLLPHSKAVDCYQAIESLFDAHRADMDAHGIFVGTLFATVGRAGTVIEPCLYWPDESYALHAATIEPNHFAKLPEHKANPEARHLAHRLKRALVDIFFAHGAVHFQIGRTYRYRESLDPNADALLVKLKQILDPKGLMNPSALQLGNPSDAL